MAVHVVVFPLSGCWGHFSGSINVIVLTSMLYSAILCLFKTYSTDWRYASVKEYLLLIFGCCIAAAASLLTALAIHNPYVYLKLNLAANLGIMAMICSLRICVRAAHRLVAFPNKSKSKRILIIGAGRLAVMLLRDIWNNKGLKYNVVGLIDDDTSKIKTRVCGASVIGTRNDIQRICKEKNVEEIIFAIYTISPKQKTEILDICSKTDCAVKILPGIEATLYGTNQLTQVREIEIEDLLERDPINLNNGLIENDIRDKVVLVTGGGGSIGSELCRQILRYNPRRLIIFDIYENNAFELQNELLHKFPKQDIKVLIGSVRDPARLEALFEKYRPNIVFHAAAHKHVPLMEYSPGEAIKNNVFGTYNTARCAEKYGTERFVLISTDKAVNPTNIMGASKRLCEMIVQTLNKNGKTEFVAVRFGNVLGSNGSVIPTFKKQIASGGPVTVTHPEITRFFMTIPEAAQLVLQAASYARGGEIFILDMGQPVKIYDLAEKMISLSGFVPNKDIQIVFTGLRPGEKLYEELLMNEEGLRKTEHNKIFVGQPIDLSPEELENILEKLRAAVKMSNEDVKRVVNEVVPTYHMQDEHQSTEEINTAVTHQMPQDVVLTVG
jgi:FlaA1/EpsC-like NDP-sugar epimerase